MYKSPMHEVWHFYTFKEFFYSNALKKVGFVEIPVRNSCNDSIGNSWKAKPEIVIFCHPHNLYILSEATH